MTAERVEDHRMHRERYVVPPATWEAVQRTQRDGGRVVAVGTTSVRALESAAGVIATAGNHLPAECSELGIPVLATIDTSAVSDHDLFSAMDRENRERADLSPFEQGTMYRRALDEKLYPSNRRLAEALGVSHTWVANVLLVADLPPPIVECFRSPLDIQHRHAKTIATALEADRKAVLRRAEKLRALERPRAATAVVSALVGGGAETAEPTYQPIEVEGKSVGRWSKDRAGRMNIQIDSAHIGDDGHLAVLKAIASALKR